MAHPSRTYPSRTSTLPVPFRWQHGLNKAALHPLREATYEAVEALLSEVAAVFPDDYLVRDLARDLCATWYVIRHVTCASPGTGSAAPVTAAPVTAVGNPIPQHLGGDEVDGDCWLSDPQISEWAYHTSRPSGMGGRYQADWKLRLHGIFTDRVVSIAQGLGKRVVLWDDAMEAVASLDHTLEGVTISVWLDWVRTNY